MFDRARAYIAKVPTAAKGSRNDTLNKLAFQVLERFQLQESDFESLMLEWAGSCQPPIAEGEALKTIHSAWAGANGKGVVGSKARNGVSTYQPHRKSAASPKPAPARYDLSGGEDLPEPLADGARELIRKLFQPGEGVRIVNAKIDDDKGGEVPDGAGPCLSREEWLRKLDRADGDPNAIFSSTKRTGIYVAINPLKLGGSKDTDVTAYRHALVEIDKGLSPEEQLNLYQQAKLPCAAVIFSGGKSVHAWVKIDAANRKEYDDRVRLLYEHFESGSYPIDTQNKNPGRLSRLPNCVRFNRRQELLALNPDWGCKSFTEWLKHIDSEALGKCDRFSDLIALDPNHDPNCVIGFRDDNTTLRFLCRGKSAWLLGPSGIGKSSLISEFAIAWALGSAAYGIRPSKPLKSLIIQAENDRYDLAEMVKGIAGGHKLDAFDAAEQFESVDSLVLFKTETQATGAVFIDKLHRLIDRERPDIVWIDPLLSFSGIDVSRQDQVTTFLREMITPVLESTGCVMIGVHHTGKPKSARETANWTPIDWAYSGLGSSELVNWARAVMLLRPISDHQFELKLAKRGPRAGATNPDGSRAYTSIWLSHARGAIRWVQTEPPPEAQHDAKEKDKTKDWERLAASNLHTVLSQCPKEGESALAIAKRMHAFSRKTGCTVGLTNCRTNLLDALVKNGKLTTDGEKYFKGPNA